ncbi:MAG: signal peptide peptidase SppA [Candidatus Tectomicrobia bacterium]|uniref:Signal peptide peptidase SppA n=1 Tax=Tectimicrobiota bacterium TaxID=2528274 RepID=A0A932CLK2_UNCTE|nr:signal peptide peptidase SppA [Candidatus Tectomicrobia bacterium]
MKESPFRKALIGLLVVGALFWVFTLAFRLLVERGGPLGGGGKVAVVEVSGVISDAEETVEQLRKFGENKSIRSIVLRIDSPGGGVVPSQEIYQKVQELRQQGKKIVASMGSTAASGGYYIACASDKIMANPGTITGSIGVIMAMANVEDLMKKVGYRSVVIKSGEHKDIGSPFRAISPQERRFLQGVLDDVHRQFVEAVARGRRMQLESVKKLADGRIFTGQQAKENGLVDELGSLSDAVSLAGRLGGIAGKPEIVRSRKPRSWLSRILKGQFSPGSLFPLARDGMGLEPYYLWQHGSPWLLPPGLMPGLVPLVPTP